MGSRVEQNIISSTECESQRSFLNEFSYKLIMLLMELGIYDDNWWKNGCIILTLLNN